VPAIPTRTAGATATSRFRGATATLIEAIPEQAGKKLVTGGDLLETDTLDPPVIFYC